jgi:hypothetical protein
MKSDTKIRLKELLGTYDQKVAEEERQVAAKRAAEEAFPVRFAALKAETIRPAIQEFVDVLGSYGHEATEHQQEESLTTGRGVSFAAISVRIHPKPRSQHHKPGEASKGFVEVTFSANRNERKIVVSSTNTVIHSSGSVGKRGEYDIDAVTSDVVADHILQTLEEALR